MTDVPLPGSGGSYRREADGSLKAAEPPAEAAPEAPVKPAAKRPVKEA